MQVTRHHIALALLVGPLAHMLAGLRRRASLAALPTLALALAWPYWQYLQIFAAIHPGGDTARELTATCIQANQVLFANATSWLPVALGLLAAANLACALDLALLRRRQRR